MEFSFIHVSDIHLGRPFSDLSKYSYDEKVKEKYKTAVAKSFNNVIDFAISKYVDFVFIAGDTFDSFEQDFSSKLILKEGLKKLENSGVKVFAICGNHDPVSSYNKTTFNYDENSNIKIIGLNTETFVKLPLINRKNEKVGFVQALSFEEEKFNGNPVRYFSQPADNEINLFNIGLLHCDLNADSTSPYAPCLLSELKALNFNYWALGHIHIPDLKEDCIQYTGTIQGRNTKETGAHGIRYVRVQDNKIIQNSFVPIDVIRFEDIVCDISFANDEFESINAVYDEINKVINNEQNICEVFLLRLDIKGCVKFYNEINEKFFNEIINKIKVDFSEKVYISQITNSVVPLVDDDLLREDDGITGAIYNTFDNNDQLENAFNLIKEQLKNVILNCNFKEEEYESFKQQVIYNAKEEGISLCNSLYNTESEEV